MIKDPQSERIYFLLQEKADPKKVIFHYVLYSLPFANLSHIDYHNIVAHILKTEVLGTSYSELHFNLQLHHIDLKTGDWKIHKP